MCQGCHVSSLLLQPQLKEWVLSACHGEARRGNKDNVGVSLTRVAVRNTICPAAIRTKHSS